MKQSSECGAKCQLQGRKNNPERAYEWLLFPESESPHYPLSALNHMLQSPDQKWAGSRKDCTCSRQMCCRT